MAETHEHSSIHRYIDIIRLFPPRVQLLTVGHESPASATSIRTRVSGSDNVASSPNLMPVAGNRARLFSFARLDVEHEANDARCCTRN